MKIPTLKGVREYIKRRRVRKLLRKGYLLTSLIRDSRKNGSAFRYIHYNDATVNGKVGNLFLICSSFMGLISPENAINSPYEQPKKTFKKHPELVDIFEKIRFLDSVEGIYSLSPGDAESIAILQTITEVWNSLPTDEDLFYSITSHVENLIK